MKPRESIVRLKMFQVQERQRQLTQLTMMMEEFERMARELEAQIAQEEQKCGISDITHFTYPSLARSVRQRHENLCHSLEDLAHQRQAMQGELDTATAELAQVQTRFGQEQEYAGVVTNQDKIAVGLRRAMIG